MSSPQWPRVGRSQIAFGLAFLALAAGTAGDDKGDTRQSLLQRADLYGQQRQYEKALEALGWAWRLSDTPAKKSQVRLAQADLLVEYSRHLPPWSTVSEDDGPALEESSVPVIPPGQGEVQDAAEALYREAIDYGGREDGDLSAKIAAVNNLAVLWMENGGAAAAVKLLLRQLEEVPDAERPRFLYNLGVANERSQRLQKAFEAYIQAAREQPNFRQPFEAALRLASRRPLPDSAPAAVELLRLARQAGNLLQMEALLSTFLRHQIWFDHPEYEHGILGELVRALSSPGIDREQFELAWGSLLDELVSKVPERLGDKVQEILRAFRSDPAGDPYRAWKDSAEDRTLFAGLLKAIGDTAFRRDHWYAAFGHYWQAWTMDPDNLDTAAYLLNLIVHAPAEIDPDGAAASDLVEGLEALRAQYPTAEVAGTYRLAGEALHARDRAGQAIAAWEVALSMSDRKSPLRPVLYELIAVASLDLDESGSTEDPSRNPLPGSIREPKMRIAVFPLENRTGRDTETLEELASEMANQLATALEDTGRFVVLDRQWVEEILQERQVEDPQDPARRIPAQFFVRVAITDIENQIRNSYQSGSLLVRKATAEIDVHLQLTEVSSGMVVASKSVGGSTTGTRLQLSTSNLEEPRLSELLMQAAHEAVEETVEEIVADLHSRRWQGEIAYVSDQRVVVDAGLEENLVPGLRLQVLGRETEKEIGTLEVVQAGSGFSIARAVAGRDFARGHVVRPAVGSEEHRNRAPRFHVVRKGEMLAGIAQTYGMSVRELMEINQLNPRARLVPGQRLRILPDRDLQYHVVQRGETLSGIAQRYGITTKELMKRNQIVRSANLVVGQRLRILPKQDPYFHVVRKGETLAGIARRYGMTVAELMGINQLESAVLRPGQQLRIRSEPAERAH